MIQMHTIALHIPTYLDPAIADGIGCSAVSPFTSWNPSRSATFTLEAKRDISSFSATPSRKVLNTLLLHLGTGYAGPILGPRHGSTKPTCGQQHSDSNILLDVSPRVASFSAPSSLKTFSGNAFACFFLGRKL